jgi:hypothetical protein
MLKTKYINKMAQKKKVNVSLTQKAQMKAGGFKMHPSGGFLVDEKAKEQMRKREENRKKAIESGGPTVAR